MCCCTKLKFLGCLDACGDEVIITGAGEFTIMNLEVGETVQQIAGTVGETQTTFVTPKLMVGYVYRFWLTKPDGTKYVDGDGNDCYSIEAINFYS